DGAASIYRCPSSLNPEVVKKLRDYSLLAVNALQLRSCARLDFKVTADDSVYLYDVIPVPDMDRNSPIFAAARHSGFSPEEIFDLICNKAAKEIKAETVQKETAKAYKNVALKVGLTYNMKRLDPKIHGDREAEYDPPKTLDAIASAISSFGHTVVMLETNETLPQNMAESDVDIVFNIAEGFSGRTREAQVPALCDLCGIPHTGSDATTLAITMDKALTKDLLIRNGIATPQYQLFRSAKDKLDPNMKFPLIVKPNAEGSSKGITQNSVVYNEDMLRENVKQQIFQYNQPVLVEQYITGREFTVGLLHVDSLKALPPLEVVFLRTDISHPVYSFEIKQEWDMNVRYDCPAQIDKKLERTLSLAAKKA
ncbi:MAG: D-alanine--D-alanine ligase, partial [Deltaproteobacteria bacterium]|nr:D-alanine--D-alanine ligase [Deltaproteobacteria bacterium]